MIDNSKRKANDVKDISCLRGAGDVSSGRRIGKDTQVVNKRMPCASSRAAGSLKIGSVNVGTMTKRSSEVVEMVARRRLDFCCLQETRWKGGSARMLEGGEGRYKFFWIGCSEGVSGVGILVAEKWADKVIEVRRICERVIVLRVIVGKAVLNLVSAYAPQVGRSADEKEEFLVTLGAVLTKIDAGEGLIVCGDMNGHVGALANGFESVHGGRGFGERNAEGEMLLEFLCGMDMIVANTWFEKEEAKKITYESGGSRTVIDYVLVRKADRRLIQDVKVIPGEACLTQHKLLVAVLTIKPNTKKAKELFISRPRIWRLKEAEVRQSFATKVHAKNAVREKGNVEHTWKGLKDCLMEVSESVCGKTKGKSRHKETWWWSEDISKLVEKKRKCFLELRKSDTVANKVAYRVANKSVKKAIAKAKEQECKRIGENLESADGKGNLFRVAKQMAQRNRDVIGGGCVRGKDGRLEVENEKIKEVWKLYYEKLLNEEFEWDRNGLDKVEAVHGPCEEITKDEIRVAIGKAKAGKAAGPSGVVSEWLKAAGEAGVEWVTDVCNAVMNEGRMPDDWKKSLIVNVYKGKGDALECGSYRGIKLLDHVMKVFERVIEKRLRSRVNLDEMQCGFRPGKGTTDGIFILRQMQERYLMKKRELWIAFVDLEKAFDRVPRDVVWWALRTLGIEECIVNVIKAMYEGATTAVKIGGGESQSFEVKVGVHQGSVLSPLLFTLVLEALSVKFREGLPWELLYADDLALIADTEEQLMEKIKVWKAGMEGKGLRVNMSKTKVMRCNAGNSNVSCSGEWPCGVCHKGVGANSIECTVCLKWIHKKCSGVSGRLQGVVGFKCKTCLTGGVTMTAQKKSVSLGLNEELECVESFCYLGDTIGCGGGVEEASRTRVRSTWCKFHELSPVLLSRGVSLKLKGKFYRTCVQRVLVYGTETWATRVEDMQRLERTERMMVRWMCGVSLKDRRSSEELANMLDIEKVSDVVRRGRLRWFGHVERKSADDWLSSCREVIVDGVRGPGRGKKTWMECVEEDMTRMGLKRDEAQDRASWRRGIFGNRLTRASAEKQTLNR
jgi:hypothetical protein